MAAAHARGSRVTAHSGRAERGVEGVAAGSTRSSTASSWTRPSPREMAAAGDVPRLDARRPALVGRRSGRRRRIDRFASAEGRGALAERRRAKAEESVRIAHRAGVRIATGTDFGGGSLRANQLAWEVESLVGAGLRAVGGAGGRDLAGRRAPRRAGRRDPRRGRPGGLLPRPRRSPLGSGGAVARLAGRLGGLTGPGPDRLDLPVDRIDGHPDQPRPAPDLRRPACRHGALDRRLRAVAGSAGLYSSVVTTQPGAKTRIHHHGPCETSIYILSGHARFTFGPTGLEEDVHGRGRRLRLHPGRRDPRRGERLGCGAARRRPDPELPGLARRLPRRRRGRRSAASAGLRADAGHGGPCRSVRRGRARSLAELLAATRVDRRRGGAVPERRLVRRHADGPARPRRPVRPEAHSWAADWIARSTRDHALREAVLAADPVPFRGAARLRPPRGRGRRDRGRDPDAGPDRLLIPWDRADGGAAVVHGEALDRVLATAAAIHVMPWAGPAGSATAAPRRPSWPWCPVRERIQLLSRASAERYRAGGLWVGERFLSGWDAFDRLAPPADGRPGRAALTADPAPLLAALERLPSTCLHGDLKLANVALLPDGRAACIDWQLTTQRAGCGRARMVPRRERHPAGPRAGRAARALPVGARRRPAAAGPSVTGPPSAISRSWWASCCAAGARAWTRRPEPSSRPAPRPPTTSAGGARRPSRPPRGGSDGLGMRRLASGIMLAGRRRPWTDRRRCRPTRIRLPQTAVSHQIRLRFRDRSTNANRQRGLAQTRRRASSRRSSRSAGRSPSTNPVHPVRTGRGPSGPRRNATSPSTVATSSSVGRVAGGAPGARSAASRRTRSRSAAIRARALRRRQSRRDRDAVVHQIRERLGGIVEVVMVRPVGERPGVVVPARTVTRIRHDEEIVSPAALGCRNMRHCR